MMTASIENRERQKAATSSPPYYSDKQAHFRMRSFPLLSISVAILIGCCQCFPFLSRSSAQTRRTSSQPKVRIETQIMARGRKSIRETVGGSTPDSSSSSSSSSGFSSKPSSSNDETKNKNWTPVKGIQSLKDLPRDEDVVKVVETMADILIDGATNPTGAVSILNKNGKTYCFSVSCASCKFPLLKAKVLSPNAETSNLHPRLVCDFCKATYNVKTGERIQDDEARGLIGTVVKGLFSATEKTPLRTFELGEKNGQVFINLP